jgi:hypothetical protein
VGDAPFEHGLRGEFMVQMHRVDVAGNPREEDDVGLGDGLGEDRTHAYGQFLNGIAHQVVIVGSRLVRLTLVTGSCGLHDAESL